MSDKFKLYVKIPNYKIRHTPQADGFIVALLDEGFYPIRLHTIIHSPEQKQYWACISYKEYETVWVLLQQDAVIVAFLVPVLHSKQTTTVLLYNELEKLQTVMLDTCDILKKSIKDAYEKR